MTQTTSAASANSFSHAIDRDVAADLVFLEIDGFGSAE